MSNVIQFLEHMGRRPALSAADYSATVAELDVDGSQRQALLERNHEALNDLLDGRPKMFFYVNTPSPDEQQDPIPDESESEDVPDVEKSALQAD